MDALSAVVAAVPGEMGRSMGYSSRPYKTYNKDCQTNDVYNKMSGPTRMAVGNEDKGKATNVLGTMVVAVPVVRSAYGCSRRPRTSKNQDGKWTRVDQAGPLIRPFYGL